MKMRVIDIY